VWKGDGRGGTKKGLAFHSPNIHHLACVGEVEKHIAVEKHNAVMTELNCDGIPIR